MNGVSKMKITTTEMHTGGGPVRIVESGYPELVGETLLEKRRYAKENLDHIRKILMHEPRGHHDMFGVVLVKPDHPDADFAGLLLQNDGYGTMCGHVTISLCRYAVDKGLVKNVKSPETVAKLQLPCGLIEATVEYADGKAGNVRFKSVPAFAFAIDIEVDVPKYGKIKIDIGYGGAFYAFVSAQQIGLDIRQSKMATFAKAGNEITKAIQKQVKVHHPEIPEISCMDATIFTDGKDDFSEEPTFNVTIFGDKEVDRSTCGSGVTARLAVQLAKGQISLGQKRTFRAAATGSPMFGTPVQRTKLGKYDAVIVEVEARGHYTGTATFTLEEEDPFQEGFLVC